MPDEMQDKNMNHDDHKSIQHEMPESDHSMGVDQGSGHEMNMDTHEGHGEMGHDMQSSAHTEVQMPAHGMNMDHGAHHGMYGGAAGAWLSILFFVVVGVWVAAKAVKPVSEKRFDLFRLPLLEKAVKSPYFSFSLRLIPALLFILVLATGFFGRTRANLAAPFTWLFWWTLLIFFVAFGGKIFCAACPWDFFSNLFQFGWFYRVKGKVQTLNLKWPKLLRNTYLAVVFFIIFTWLELGVELTQNSYLTAWLGLSVVVIAVLSALIFEKRSFCRYACPIGRISGIYAQFSPLELRQKDAQVCKDCKTIDCVRGGTYSTPCPTLEVPFKLSQNTYCTLCTECVRSCDKDNLTLKLRPPAYDLQNTSTYRMDESILIYVILVLTFFHGLTMTNIWVEWTEGIGRALDLSYLSVFSILLTTILAGSFAVFYLFEKLIGHRFGKKGISMMMIYALVPVVLGYHIGHNLMHILDEVTYLFPLFNDPFGWGWNLLGLKGYTPGPLAGHGTMMALQLIAICLGFYYSAKILKIRSFSISDKLFGSEAAKGRSLYYAHYALLLAIGILGIWFVFQPMAMRGSY